MELGSVRALKTELFARMTAVAVERDFPIATLGWVRAEPVRQPTVGLALGVAANPGTDRDYRLAIRISDPVFNRDERFVSDLATRARGEVDIRRVGSITMRNPHRRRPPTVGCSIAHQAVSAGTLGAFVRQQGDERLMILSNNHVLADEDAGRPGDPILQPGAADGGIMPGDVLGALHQAIPLRATGNRWDAALAVLSSETDEDSLAAMSATCLSRLADTIPLPGLSVRKLGRTTGITRGIVTATELQGVIVRSHKSIRSFDDQIEIAGIGGQPFSAGGDSGSVIVDDDGAGVGLLFAGSDRGGPDDTGLTYANDLRTVFARLRLKLPS